MATAKRLKNAAGVRGSHSKGSGPGPGMNRTDIFKGDDDAVADRLAGTTTDRHTLEAAFGTDYPDADSTGIINMGMRDARDNAVQVVTFTGDDTDTVTLHADGRQVDLVVGTNTTKAAVQAALRTLTGSTDVVVTGTDDTGPLTFTLGSRDDFVVSMIGPSDDAASVANTPVRAIDALGESAYSAATGESATRTALPVVAGLSTDAVGPAAGGIDVNYTIGAYTGVHVVITVEDHPDRVLFDGYEASSTPFRIEAADFPDGVGPGSGVEVDVFVQGYLDQSGPGGTTSQLGPWADAGESVTA